MVVNFEMVSGVTKLHIGGTQVRQGWHILNIQPGLGVDFVGDCCNLSVFATESIQEIYASHVLEHVSHTNELQAALEEINRVLVIGGKLSIGVPDFERLSQLYFHPDAGIGLKCGVVNILFGGQHNTYDFHRCAFDEKLLTSYLQSFGFTDIERVDDFGLFDDATTYKYCGVPVSLNLVAYKRASVSVAPQTVSKTKVEDVPQEKTIMGPTFTIPDEMLHAYTMQGRVPITLFFLAETSGGVLQWSNEYYQSLMNRMDEIVRSDTQVCYETDPHLYRMLKSHPIAGQDALVIGSVQPFYEALISYFGGVPSTLEYRKIYHDIPGLMTHTVDEFQQVCCQFDVIVSISSIEHDGLGRYGDPLDPDGDLKTMQRCKSYLRRGGLLFLSVPVGRDAVCWNAHRIYGRVRLPLLLDGWRLLDASGFHESLFEHGQTGVDYVQPVFVLQNT